ncbi:MAG: putative transposase [Chloroflexi bacterium ADurb.Bin360]|nr:MAG: putative transposase [Chloroflexi bacterium ADurb.Bin360]
MGRGCCPAIVGRCGILSAVVHPRWGDTFTPAQTVAPRNTAITRVATGTVPKCQHDKAQQWLEAQQDLLLPVPYFLLTFTLPEALRRIARSQQRLFYDLLFRVAAEAIQQLGQNGRWVGGQMGMLGVMHTWGRNLAYHPHVHFLVPGGGVDQAGMWHAARSSFLLPVKALSRLMRAKFRDGLCRANAAIFSQVPSRVWQQEWVVHCQAVGTGANAVKYLAAYVFRVAISNRRIVKLENDQVTFRYRETGTGKLKYCTLPAEVFIHRFLQHVLPRRLVKVRYYGFLAPGQRQRLAALRQQMARPDEKPAPITAEDEELPSNRLHEVRCPACQQVMKRGTVIQPTAHGPP